MKRVELNTPIDGKQLSDEFLRTLCVLGKTYGNTGDYDEVKDFICYAFKISGNTVPSDLEMEPFVEED